MRAYFLLATLLLSGCAGSISAALLPCQSEKPHTVTAPQGMTAQVGQTLPLSVEASCPVQWGTADPDKVSIEQDGVVKALAPGGVRVFAESGGETAQVLLASVESPEIGKPVVASQLVVQDTQNRPLRTAEIINSEEGWATLWETGLAVSNETSVTSIPPTIDFTSNSVLVIFDGKLQGEEYPVVTHIENGAAPSINVVFPKVNNPRKLTTPGFPHWVFLLKIPKTASGAKVNLRHMNSLDRPVAGKEAANGQHPQEPHLLYPVRLSKGFRG